MALVGALLLLFAADAGAAAPAKEAPCRLLTVDAQSGAETFLSCTRTAVRLEPGRTHQLVWNPTLERFAIVSRGPDNDLALIISNSETEMPLVEDWTPSIVAAAQRTEPERPIIGIRVTDATVFATASGLKIGSVEPATKSGSVEMTWSATLDAEPTEKNGSVKLAR